VCTPFGAVFFHGDAACPKSSQIALKQVASSAHIRQRALRVRSTLATLARNKWVEIDQTVGELRIRLGERGKLN
jgi:hypothetical protein